ncbi:MAG TPA: KEOPS complex kinase/ATPase Bud32 [Nitrososphaeraceae archaeon]|nr:KEOPS complex kinase/ATPase Bud32 [Nitrososphaeraceae archaeon]
MQDKRLLIKRGAEADIYLIQWYNKKAISKVRIPKPYRHRSLDNEIRKYRTIHEAAMSSAAKEAGIISPFIYFTDPFQAEIIMEFIQGKSVKDVLTPQLSYKMGVYTALLHTNNIVHGDLTTSNFIASKKVVLIDFGLSYYSTRIEDKAVDIRLIRQVFSSAHTPLYKDVYESFIEGYLTVVDKKKMHRILESVSEIEQRGRYARVI